MKRAIGISAVVFGVLASAAALFWGFRNAEPEEDPVQESTLGPLPPVEIDFDERGAFPPPPPPPEMERIKYEGCVADMLLHGDYADHGSTLDLVNRSQCYYLHRAVDTWLRPPDWPKIIETESKLRDGFVFGMFIAEAIDTKAEYWYREGGRNFRFDDMCRNGTKNDWGEHTCKPSFEREEYRRYLREITRAAMDNDVQVFTFGQVFYQDTRDRERSLIPEIIAEMRAYADLRGMKILVGAQTGDIDDAEYLRLFDFIEGGVGIDAAGRIEGGPCHSRWWKKEGDWCWGLLWNDRFRTKARNVLVHLDWSGIIGDDMSTFSRMDEDRRRYVIEGLHAYFMNREVGFLLPFIAPLHRDNGGCYGPTRWFYTPDNRHGCRDEAYIQSALEGGARKTKQ